MLIGVRGSAGGHPPVIRGGACVHALQDSPHQRKGGQEVAAPTFVGLYVITWLVIREREREKCNPHQACQPLPRLAIDRQSCFPSQFGANIFLVSVDMNWKSGRVSFSLYMDPYASNSSLGRMHGIHTRINNCRYLCTACIERAGSCWMTAYRMLGPRAILENKRMTGVTIELSMLQPLCHP